MKNIEITKSEKTLILILFLLIFSAIGYAYYVSTQVELREPKCSPGIQLAEGEYFADTLIVEYSHLYISFHEVQFNPHLENIVYVEGYENVREFYDVQVVNDTLRVTPKTECDPRPVETDGLSAVKIIVGASNLKSITIDKNGKLLTPIKPYGADETGRPVYSQSQLKRHLYVFDSLIINLQDYGTFNILVKGEDLTMNYDNYFSGNPSIYGEVDLLEVNHKGNMGKFVSLYATNTQVNRVIVNTNKNTDPDVNGSISITVRDDLRANLYGNLDVFYNGNPEIAKTEISLGRVVNVNGVK